MRNPVTLAETAIATGRRRRVGEFAVMLTGAALVVTIWIVMAGIVIPALNRAEAGTPHTETIQLRCLSPKQAGDIIEPYVRSNASAYFLPSSGISAITVRGTHRELEISRNLIREFEENPGAACRAPIMVGHPDATSPLGRAGSGTRLGKSGTQYIDLGASSSGALPTPEKITTQPKK